MTRSSRDSRTFAANEVAQNLECLAHCRALPKLELCAHLNGSVRDSTLKELAAGMQLAGCPVSLDKLVALTEETSPSLAECFALFDVVHALTTSHAATTRITRECIEDFAADNVFYCELRTTPKCKPELGVSRESYVEAVLQGIDEYYAASSKPREEDIEVRLLLSISREQSYDKAMETVQLAARLRGRGVLGVGLTGNPSVGEFEELAPALDAARKLGLKVTLEAGEGFNPAETQQMLAFAPDRLDHCCCLTPRLQLQLLQSGIPLCVCLTSNVVTRAVTGYSAHHMGTLYRKGHPLVLCTDDPGVLNTTLSQEYAIAAQASSLQRTFGLRQSDLAALVLSSADATFLPDDEKAALKERLRAAMPPCNDPPVEETSRSFDVHRSFDVQRSQEARGPRAASFDVRGQASTEVRRRGRASFSFDVRRTGPAVPTPDPVDSLGPARTLDPLLEVEPPPQPESPAGDRKAPPKGRLSGGRQWFPWRKSSDSGQRVPS